VRDAALRIARGLQVVAERPESTVAVVSHDLIVRYALNAAAGGIDISAPMREAPQVKVFELGRESLVRAAELIHEAASGAWGRAVPGPEANGG
jgi:broad specificity phosphatase PhoE